MSYQRAPNDYRPPGYGTQYSPPPVYPSAGPPPYEGYPPPPPPGYEGYPPPQGYPLSRPSGGYQGYLNEGYPPLGRAPYPPTQVYHSEHYQHREEDGCFSFLKGCLAALCCCCVLEECCF